MIVLKQKHPCLRKYVASLPENESSWADYYFDQLQNAPGLEFRSHEDFALFFHRCLEISGVVEYYWRKLKADQDLVLAGYNPVCEHALEEYETELLKRLTRLRVQKGPAMGDHQTEVE